MPGGQGAGVNHDLVAALRDIVESEVAVGIWRSIAACARDADDDVFEWSAGRRDDFAGKRAEADEREIGAGGAAGLDGDGELLGGRGIKLRRQLAGREADGVVALGNVGEAEPAVVISKLGAIVVELNGHIGGRGGVGGADFPDEAFDGAHDGVELVHGSAVEAVLRAGAAPVKGLGEPHEDVPPVHAREGHGDGCTVGGKEERCLFVEGTVHGGAHQFGSEEPLACEGQRKSGSRAAHLVCDEDRLVCQIPSGLAICVRGGAAQAGLKFAPKIHAVAVDSTGGRIESQSAAG